jgi:hypothetical protein
MILRLKLLPILPPLVTLQALALPFVLALMQHGSGKGRRLVRIIAERNRSRSDILRRTALAQDFHEQYPRVKHAYQQGKNQRGNQPVKPAAGVQQK